MAESVLSVCWKDHASELSTVYKSLLKNNFLVDCTISAEGQNLKAHRLVLSASSPYFHDLFSEETGKHPFVILLGASFESLKAVIDFVYRGEAQIPEGNLKPFLSLAQSLQIKGLNVSTKDYENKNLSSSTTENAPQDPSEKNQVTCEVQGINASQDRPKNNSQKHPHHFEGYSDAMPTKSSVPLKEFSAFGDKVRSTSVMTPSQEQWRPEGCNDISTAMEITVKNEPVYSAFLEARIEKLDNIKSDDPVSRNFTSNMDSAPSSVCVEEDLNLFSSYNEISQGNTEPSELPPSQQPLTRLRDQMSSGRDVDEERESPLPVVLVPKSEQLTDEENEEPMDYPDESGNVMNERIEETGPASAEQNLDQCSGADALPPVDDLATPQRSGVHLWGPGAQESTTLLPQSMLQLHEGQGEEQDLGAKGLASHSLTHSRERQFSCEVCGASFTCPSHLIIHNRTHTGERPYRCDVCGNSFITIQNLSRHKRMHTGERPYICDFCGKTFMEKQDLTYHRRTHTGERPYRCDLCGKTFIQNKDLTTHMRAHSGERPYRCDVCGNTFVLPHHLSRHKRTHTGERPYPCDVCGFAFARSSTLADHKRTHTGERPYICGICGKDFRNASGLTYHKRTHAEERQ